jgi:mannose/fructose/N-acetylgalactosamine-specific phosphotransferase system component IIC
VTPPDSSRRVVFFAVGFLVASILAVPFLAIATAASAR